MNTEFIYEARKAGGMGRKGKLKIAGNELHGIKLSRINEFHKTYWCEYCNSLIR